MSIRVLIVEDNAVARSFLIRVVRESFSDDIQFSEASDLDTARAALGIGASDMAQASADSFRLVLCDLEQPDNSGLELLAQLRHYPAIKIATTLHSDDDHLFPALQCGASGYLLKEDRFEVLVEDLQKIVQGQPPLSPAMARRMLGVLKRRPDTRPAPLDPLGAPPDSVPPADVGEDDLLTSRESEVLTYLAKGFTIKEIARLMGIKWLAVNDHIRQAYRKLARVSSPSDAIKASRQLLNWP